MLTLSFQNRSFAPTQKLVLTTYYNKAKFRYQSFINVLGNFEAFKIIDHVENHKTT